MCERTPWEGGYIGINAFGVGGSNVHVLLSSPDSSAFTRTEHAASAVTRLMTFAARTEEGVEATLAEMTRHPTDVDMQYLLQSSSENLSPVTHPYRGFGLLNVANSQHTVQVQTVSSVVTLRQFGCINTGVIKALKSLKK